MDTTTIRVVVQGVQGKRGNMLLALFASHEGFPGDVDKALRRMQAPVDADSILFTIERVPAGRYALSILHDENANGKMESDFFGRPEEGYGFSRNARGFMGPPSFDDAAFYATAEPLTIRIALVYR